MSTSKTLIREFLEKEANRNEMFKGGAEAIMGRLDKVAVAVGNALYESMGTDLAQKVSRTKSFSFSCLLLTRVNSDRGQPLSAVGGCL